MSTSLSFVSCVFQYQYAFVSRLAYSVNDLLNGVQANDARAFLVGSCIPGFALCGRETGQLLHHISTRDKQQ